MSVSHRIALGAFLAVVAPVSTSDAASVSRFGETVVYTGAARNASDLRLTATTDRLVFRERRNRIAAGVGCVRTSRRAARCDVAGVTTVALILGAEDDVVDAAPSVLVGLFVRGGSGDDGLQGGSQGDDVAGGPGNDVVDGGAGNDIVSGGSGNDAVVGSRGDDVLDGGDGDDDIQSLDGGRDQIDCGTGYDKANSGSSDRFVAACDVVRVTNTAQTSCHPGTAAAKLKPNLPKTPPRSLIVKVTGANRPAVVVTVTISTTAGPLTIVRSVATDGKWHHLRTVGPKTTGVRANARCPI